MIKRQNIQQIVVIFNWSMMVLLQQTDIIQIFSFCSEHWRLLQFGLGMVPLTRRAGLSLSSAAHSQTRRCEIRQLFIDCLRAEHVYRGSLKMEPFTFTSDENQNLQVIADNQSKNVTRTTTNAPHSFLQKNNQLI